MSRLRSGRSRTTIRVDDDGTHRREIQAGDAGKLGAEGRKGSRICDPVRVVRGPIHCSSTDRRRSGWATGEQGRGRTVERHRGSRPDAIAALAGLLPATLPATAVTSGPTWWSRWTRAARETLAGCPRTTPWTAARETCNPRVLGSNPSRLTTVPSFAVQKRGIWRSLRSFRASLALLPATLPALLAAMMRSRSHRHQLSHLLEVPTQVAQVAPDHRQQQVLACCLQADAGAQIPASEEGTFISAQGPSVPV